MNCMRCMFFMRCMHCLYCSRACFLYDAAGTDCAVGSVFTVRVRAVKI